MKRNTLMLLLLGGLALLAWWWFGRKATDEITGDTQSTGTQKPVDLASYLVGGASNNTVADLVKALTGATQPTAGTTTQATPATATPATTTPTRPKDNPVTMAAKGKGRPMVTDKSAKAAVVDPNAIRRV